MSDDIEVSIKTADGVTVSVSEYDDGAWINLMNRNGSFYTALTREEAQHIFDGLQTILFKRAS